MVENVYKNNFLLDEISFQLEIEGILVQLFQFGKLFQEGYKMGKLLYVLEKDFVNSEMLFFLNVYYLICECFE